MGRTGQDDEDALLFEDVELSHVWYRDDLDGNLVLVAQVGEVDAVVSPVDHAVAVVCETVR